MSADIYVTGVGIQPFGEYPELSLTEMAAPAISQALEAADVDLDRMEEAFVGNALGHSGSVAEIAENLGLERIPVTRIEQACASGSAALRQACEAVASGRRETVLAVGVEKMGKGMLQLEDEPGYAARLGLVFPLLYGYKSRQYMESSGMTARELADIAAKAHRLGAACPHASARDPVTVETILASPMIADPVTRLQCCRNADGAAAAIVTTNSRKNGVPRITSWIGGIGVEDTAEPMRDGWDCRETIVETLVRDLYEKAGIGPKDIGIVQLNDAFAVAEPLYLEALGFAPRGEGIELHRAGRTGPTGDLPTNTDGGLIGRGHCLGATGLAMLYEVWMQMNGRAGSRQLDNRPSTGLIQSHGYGGENLFTLVN